MKKTLAIITYLSISCSIGLSDTLIDALKSAYETNENLKNYQEKYKQDIESLPIALSEFLPRSSFSVSSSENRLKFKDTINPSTGGKAEGTSKTTFARGIQVNQNLFNSFGSTFGLKAANQIYYISKNVYYSNEQEFILKSIESYLQYLFAQEALKLAEQNLKYTLKTYQSAQERFKIGEATKSDVANASYEKSKAEADLSSAHQNLVKTREVYKLTFNKEPGLVEFPKKEANAILEPDLINVAIEKNYNLKASIASMKKADYDVKRAFSSIFPSVDAGYNYQSQKYSDWKDPQLDMQYAFYGNHTARSSNMSLSINVPILSQGGAEYARIRQQKSSKRSQVNQLNFTKKTISANVKNLIEAKKSLDAQIKSAKDAVSAAEVALDSTYQEQKIGTKTTDDIILAQRNLFNAQNQLLQAKISLLTATYSIDATIGKLTAKEMGLKVNYFDPDKIYRNTRIKVIGF